MQDLERIEVTLKDAKQKVELGHALLRLRKNRDFKAIITISKPQS